MDNFLLSIGLWNFFGSILMFFFMNERFGQLVLVEWTKIFSTDYKVGYYGKLWLAWAAGLNIFFAVMNIMAVIWDYSDLKYFLAFFDMLAYVIFIIACLFGIAYRRLQSGIYIAIVIFLGWISWAFLLFINQ